MAEPLSKLDKSTRDPWTDGGAEPIRIKMCLLIRNNPKKKPTNEKRLYTTWNGWIIWNVMLPVYEKRPDGLLRGRSELIVLALRCNEFAVFIAFESSWDNDDVLLFNRSPCRGDDGQDDVCRFWLIDNRDRDAFDFFRKIPCLVSALQTPFF